MGKTGGGGPDLPSNNINSCLQSNLDGDVIIAIEVQPNSSRDEIVGINSWRGRLQIAVSAPATKGAANKAVQKILSDKLELSSEHLELTSGHTSRQKMIRIKKIELEIIKERLHSIVATGKDGMG